jgi:hypothetical protein
MNLKDKQRCDYRGCPARSVVKETIRGALTIALTIDGGFGRIRAVPGGRKGQ